MTSLIPGQERRVRNGSIGEDVLEFSMNNLPSSCRLLAQPSGFGLFLTHLSSEKGVPKNKAESALKKREGICESGREGGKREVRRTQEQFPSDRPVRPCIQHRGTWRPWEERRRTVSEGRKERRRRKGTRRTTCRNSAREHRPGIRKKRRGGRDQVRVLRATRRNARFNSPSSS